jgi:type IV pilus assembly protein PilW
MLAPATPGDPCVVRTVTANTPAAGEVRQQLAFANTPAGMHNQVAFSTNPTYSDRARVTLLGDLRWSRYERSGTDLVLSQPLGGGSAVLLRNVIGFRAQYGVAANVAGSTTLENWQDATGGDFGTLTAAALPRVRALRVGIVTRSPQREKPDASGNCVASSAKPVLFGVTVEPDVADWQCFRYRTAVAVVPLRNLVYGMTP